MSKELEAFNKLMEESPEVHIKSYEIVINALQRLEAIENANPSEALEALRSLGEALGTLEIDKDTMLPKVVLFGNRAKHYKTVEQALLKANEQEKVLKIIFEKQVDFEVFGAFDTYKDYEIYYNKRFHVIEHKLTEEEFEIVKRYCDEKKS